MYYILFCIVQVVSILSLNPQMPISVASDFISNHLKILSEGIAAVEDDLVPAMNDLETISYMQNAQSQVMLQPCRYYYCVTKSC